MTTNPAETALAALGFTDTEAAVYCELLRGGAAMTGYRLAQAVGKAPANTYQALAALSQKGAVLVDESDAKAYRAVAPGELLAAMERGFQARREDAQAALEDLHAAPQDDRIYHLKTPAQVYERARAMIEGAREVILFDLFPGPFDALRLALEHAHAGGVTVAGLVYRPVEHTGFVALESSGAAFVAERWPGQQLSLVVDAREHMLVLLSPDGRSVRHGVWSDSTYLACLEHSGLASEIRLAARDAEEAEALRALALLRAYPPGLRALVGPPAAAPGETDAA